MPRTRVPLPGTPSRPPSRSPSPSPTTTEQIADATTLWRVRVVLPDRPGALARLAQTCGSRGVNILGMEVLPDIGVVTDELILAVPSGWGVAEVVDLVEDAGGRPNLVGLAPTSALADQVVRHLDGIRSLGERPLTSTQVLADLLDAEVEADRAGNQDQPRRAGCHRLTLWVGGETIALVREAPFTPTERARADAVVELAERLAGTVSPPEPPPVSEPEPEARVPSLRVHADRVIAEIEDRMVGEASLTGERNGSRVRVYVHPAWRRRGIGLLLLREVTAVAVDRGLHELDVRLDAHDLAGLRLVLASGLCGAISCDGDETRTRLVLPRPVTAR